MKAAPYGFHQGNGDRAHRHKPADGGEPFADAPPRAMKGRLQSDQMGIDGAPPEDATEAFIVGHFGNTVVVNQHRQIGSRAQPYPVATR